jgi:hypothetical protein
MNLGWRVKLWVQLHWYLVNFQTFVLCLKGFSNADKNPIVDVTDDGRRQKRSPYEEIENTRQKRQAQSVGKGAQGGSGGKNAQGSGRGNGEQRGNGDQGGIGNEGVRHKRMAQNDNNSTVQQDSTTDKGQHHPHGPPPHGHGGGPHGPPPPNSNNNKNVTIA